MNKEEMLYLAQRLMERIEERRLQRLEEAKKKRLNDFIVKKEITVCDSNKNPVYKLKQNTKVTGIIVIASGEEIRDVQFLIEKYKLQDGTLTNAKDWQKVRGRGTVLIEELGEQSREIHWYQCKNIGKVELKIKERG